MSHKPAFLITGTDTGVGKTTVGGGIAAGFRELGLRVGVMKPAETGCERRGGELVPLDAIALRAAAGAVEPLDLICPYRYATPLAPAAAAEVEACNAPDLAEIRRRHGQIAASKDVMLVEGAGGITVPITWDANYADLALALDLELIVVVANRLGCLNGAALTLDYANRRGLRVAGYILNDVSGEDSPAVRSNAQSLRRLTQVPCLGELGYRASVALSICQRLLSSHR